MGGNPNYNFNPNGTINDPGGFNANVVGDGPAPGSYNDPSHTPSNGYPNGSSEPAATTVNAPGGDDYLSWDWEQVLFGVLGLNLPTRSEVTGFRWTVTDSKGEGNSLYEIFEASWFVGGISVYLSPYLQNAGGPWDEYYNTPLNQLTQVMAGSRDYTTIAVDPRTFGSAAVALNGVENLYLNASDTLNTMAADLNSEASEYQGEAGQAFYQLINNLYTSANSIYTQMTSPSSYSGAVGQSGTDTANFVLSIWQAMGGWREMLDHSPLGAIFQALLGAGVVSGNTINNVTNANSFGNLLTDAGWVAVETAAKNLWLNSVETALDTSARSALNMLTVSYMTTAGIVQPLTQPTLTQITSGGDNSNLSDLNGDDGGDGDFNTPSSDLDSGGLNGLGGGGGSGDLSNSPGDDSGDLGGIGDGLNSLGAGLGDLSGGIGDGFDALGGGLNGLGGGIGDGFNSLGSGLNGLGGGIGDGFNSLGGGLNGLGGGLNGLGTSLGNPGGTGGLTGLPGGTLANPTSQLQTALGDSNQEQQELEKALALAPSSGPLHNALETALADNGAVQNALQSALAGDTPAGTALQTAMTDNGGVQSALNQALASGQVPKTGPLRTALQQASGDNSHTKTALQKALASAVPGGDSVHVALAENGKLQSALNHALESGQVPRTGPLHDAVESALADARKAQHALDQALATGGTPSVSSIQQALADNRAAQNEMQKALASGQVPAAGPLRTDLDTAMADSRSVGNALRQALTSVGVPAEPAPVLTGLGLPASGGLGALAGGGGGLGGAAGAGPALTADVGRAALGGPAAASGLSALNGGVATASVPSGRFVAPGTGVEVGQAAAGEGSGAVPFYPPMAGGMGGMAGQQGMQERERTTWLAEDEDVWGTAPSVGPASIGRDVIGDDDELDGYDDYTEPGSGPRRAPSRAGVH
jgi:hypothetical protein